MRTQTHSYTTLSISQTAFDEIKDSLEKAGYSHQFKQDADGRVVIDMIGLALAAERPKIRTRVKWKRVT